MAHDVENNHFAAESNTSPSVIKGRHSSTLLSILRLVSVNDPVTKEINTVI